MAGNAVVTVACGLTIASIRWLMMLGVVRVFEVEETTRTGPGPTSGGYHRALGLVAGPSRALTNLDHTCMKIVIFTSAFWMARLALCAAGHRVGFLRGVGVLLGFG